MIYYKAKSFFFVKKCLESDAEMDVKIKIEPKNEDDDDDDDVDMNDVRK